MVVVKKKACSGVEHGRHACYHVEARSRGMSVHAGPGRERRGRLWARCAPSSSGKVGRVGCKEDSPQSRPRGHHDRHQRGAGACLIMRRHQMRVLYMQTTTIHTCSYGSCRAKERDTARTLSAYLKPLMFSRSCSTQTGTSSAPPRGPEPTSD